MNSKDEHIVNAVKQDVCIARKLLTDLNPYHEFMIIAYSRKNSTKVITDRSQQFYLNETTLSSINNQ